MSTQLYLVRSKVSRQDYMSDRQKPEVEFDIVQAISEDEASDKVRAHYENQSSAYSVSYSCDVMSVKAAIV